MLPKADASQHQTLIEKYSSNSTAAYDRDNVLKVSQLNTMTGCNRKEGMEREVRGNNFSPPMC